MTRKLKQALVVILLFSLVSVNLPNRIVVNATETDNIISGNCGDNVYYELNRNTGVLRIYGSGAMDDYQYKYDLEGNYTFLEKEAPWIEQGYSDDIATVKIEDGVTYIGTSAFSSKGYSKGGACENIDTVDISQTVTEIGSNAFKHCEKLKSLVIPSGVRTIGSHAFLGCYLSKIQLGDSLQIVGASAFEANDFAEIVFPEHLYYIGPSAFGACKELKSVEIPNNCVVKYEAFQYCSALENANIGKNCKLHGKIFWKCPTLSDIVVKEGSIGECDVKHGDDYGVFQNCTGLQSIILPDSWEFEDATDGLNAYSHQFYGCTKLKKICISNTNEKYKLIDDVIFSKDEKTLICYPAGLTATEFEIPNGVEKIEDFAFSEQGCLENVVIPAGIKIGNQAFRGCSKLNNVILPEGIEELHAGAFAWCESLKKVVLPSSLKVMIEGTGKDSILGTFDNTDLEIVYSEEGSYAAQWAGDKFEKTIYSFFDGNGGSVDIKKKPVIYGDSYHKLPTPEREGHKFLGWYTKKDAGDEVSNDTIVTEEISHTLYAHWAPDNIIGKSISETTVTLERTDYTYDGKAKQPSVTVKDGSITLISGTHYAVSYSDNVNVGTATVTVTGMGIYTGTVTKTFTIRTKNVENEPFVWGKCNWNFDNSSRYFSNYDVNNDVMNKMKKDFNLSNSDIVELKWNIANDNQSGFSGSCFGMTISEIMAHQGDLKLSRYGGNDIVNKNVNTSNMTSVINFIQELQSNSEMCQSIRQTPFLKGDYSQEEFISKLSDVATNSDYFVKLSYKIVTKNTNNGSTNNGYHAVLVYGIEKCNYYSSVTGKTYDRKILIADPNYLSGNVINNNACLYFKSSDSSWIVPYWNKTYSDGSKQSCYWNAENGVSTSNGGIRNIMRYVSLKEEVDLMAEYSAGHYIAGLEIDNISKNVSSVEKVKNSGNSNIDYAGDFSEEIARYDIDMDDDVYITENEELYALWNPTSSYTLSYVKPSDYNLKMDYETIDYYADVTNSVYTLFKPNGSITLKGSDASYDITMVTDESDCVTDWYSVTISGMDVDYLVYTKVKNGYTLSGPKLKNVKITAEGENFSADTIFDTDYEDVFIYEIDKNTIGVAVDTDNNGSYETTINTTKNHKPMDESGDVESPKESSAPDIKVYPETMGDSYKTEEPLKGTVLKDYKNKISYKVIVPGKSVEFYKTDNKKVTKVVIPDAVTIDGRKYKVTAISNNAFNGCKKLKSVAIGKNVTTIGNKAFFKCSSLKKIVIPINVIKLGKKVFYGCKRLRFVKVNTKKLKNRSVGSKAFMGIHKKAVIAVPKKAKKKYEKWLKRKGIIRTMKIK